jgi:hypothetical protein
MMERATVVHESVCICTRRGVLRHRVEMPHRHTHKAMNGRANMQDTLEFSFYDRFERTFYMLPLLLFKWGTCFLKVKFNYHFDQQNMSYTSEFVFKKHFNSIIFITSNTCNMGQINDYKLDMQNNRSIGGLDLCTRTRQP